MRFSSLKISFNFIFGISAAIVLSISVEVVVHLDVFAISFQFQMLQVDPKRRITVTQLLSHPWLMDGYEGPVKWQSKYHAKELDPTVIETMAAYKLMSPSQVSLLSFLLEVDSKPQNRHELKIKSYWETSGLKPDNNVCAVISNRAPFFVHEKRSVDKEKNTLTFW